MKSGDTDLAFSSTIPLLIFSCTLILYFLTVRTFENEILSQKHRPMTTLITRTDCSCWLYNTTLRVVVLSSLISSVPNKLCFFVSLLSVYVPHHLCPLQTTAYTSSSMNFAKACLPVCLGNVMLCRASHPVKQSEVQALIILMYPFGTEWGAHIKALLCY